MGKLILRWPVFKTNLFPNAKLYRYEIWTVNRTLKLWIDQVLYVQFSNSILDIGTFVRTKFNQFNNRILRRDSYLFTLLGATRQLSIFTVFMGRA